MVLFEVITGFKHGVINTGVKESFIAKWKLSSLLFKRQIYTELIVRKPVDCVNALINASPWVDPQDTPGIPGEWYSFGISFFPAEEGSCLVLKTTCLGHGDIPTGFVRGSATGKVKRVLSDTMVDEDEQKACQKLDTFLCYFCQ